MQLLCRAGLHLVVDHVEQRKLSSEENPPDVDCQRAQGKRTDPSKPQWLGEHGYEEGTLEWICRFWNKQIVRNRPECCQRVTHARESIRVETNVHLVFPQSCQNWTISAGTTKFGAHIQCITNKSKNPHCTYQLDRVQLTPHHQFCVIVLKLPPKNKMNISSSDLNHRPTMYTYINVNYSRRFNYIKATTERSPVQRNNRFQRFDKDEHVVRKADHLGG